jgi:hypothetical protein
MNYWIETYIYESGLVVLQKFWGIIVSLLPSCVKLISVRVGVLVNINYMLDGDIIFYENCPKKCSHIVLYSVSWYFGDNDSSFGLS